MLTVDIYGVNVNAASAACCGIFLSVSGIGGGACFLVKNRRVYKDWESFAGRFMIFPIHRMRHAAYAAV